MTAPSDNELRTFSTVYNTANAEQIRSMATELLELRAQLPKRPLAHVGTRCHDLHRINGWCKVCGLYA